MYFIRPFKEADFRIQQLKLRKQLKWLINQGGTQKIIILLCIQLAGILLLLVWYKFTSSLALLSYTYLSWFNFFSLITCLLCVWVEGQVASITYTFGLIRAEILAVFSTITLTILGALFILKESIERLIQPPTLHLDRMSLVSFIGLLLNLTMAAFAQSPPLNHIIKSSHSSLLQEHFADICQSICAHVPGMSRLLLPRINPLVLVSFTGFVLIIADHIIVEIYTYPRGDTIAAIFIALFTIVTMFPLCTTAADLLLQTIPLQFSAHIDKCLREISTIDGVLEVCKENFWILGVGSCENVSYQKSIAGSVICGSLHVRVRRDANEQLVLREVQSRLNPFVQLLTIQVFKDEWTHIPTTLQVLKDSALLGRSIFHTNINETNNYGIKRSHNGSTVLKPYTNHSHFAKVESNGVTDIKSSSCHLIG